MNLYRVKLNVEHYHGPAFLGRAHPRFRWIHEMATWLWRTLRRLVGPHRRS